MSKLIVAPPASLENDSDLKQNLVDTFPKQNLVDTLRSYGLGHAVPILDPSYSRLSTSEQYEILKSRYEQKLITDGLESGHFVLNDKGEVVIAISQPLPSVAGFIFEAFTVRRFNERKDSVGKKAFLWATERSKVKLAFLEQFH